VTVTLGETQPEKSVELPVNTPVISRTEAKRSALGGCAARSAVWFEGARPVEANYCGSARSGR
jgi:hypothetical protein